MEILPAIDIRGGKCVRLFQGDYNKETVYSDSPVDVARQWVGLGAKRIHVVDLDGAKDGAPTNMAIAGQIAAAARVPVQLGGGIRTLTDARQAILRGIDRVIIGTAALEGTLVEELCASIGPDRVVVGVDAKDGYVAVRGWTEGSDTRAADLVKRIEDMGARRFVYTDISRDGTLTEPNFASIEELLGATKLKMIVAGGVSSVEHIVRLAEIGVEAAIVGKAMYTGDIDLPTALEAIKSN